MKDVWFDYIVAHKQYWANGFTVNRLNKVRGHVFADADIMWDLLDRHGARHLNPEEMQQKDMFMFSHCIGNFLANIHNKMINKGILKIK